jgi:glycosyltransferase involved in cell wall biosynthesis
VIKRSTLVRGQRSPTAGATDNLLLRRALARHGSPEDVLVSQLPWDWPAIKATPASRRVFDMTDDWSELVPDQATRFNGLYSDIASHADEIIVVNPALASRFPGRSPTVIPNAVHREHVVSARTEVTAKTMIYLGTLSERFDAPLMYDVLQALPDWQLVLVGACLYRQQGDSPAPELERLLAIGDRVHWHGELPREEALALVDQAAVAVIPNRTLYSTGQDSMKLYDYAGRGKAIVTTAALRQGSHQQPGHVSFADDPMSFAEAVIETSRLPPSIAESQRAWALTNTWDSRWPAWSKAVFGA